MILFAIDFTQFEDTEPAQGRRYRILDALGIFLLIFRRSSLLYFGGIKPLRDKDVLTSKEMTGFTRFKNQASEYKFPVDGR